MKQLISFKGQSDWVHLMVTNRMKTVWIFGICLWMFIWKQMLPYGSWLIYECLIKNRCSESPLDLILSWTIWQSPVCQSRQDAESNNRTVILADSRKFSHVFIWCLCGGDLRDFFRLLLCLILTGFNPTLMIHWLMRMSYH